MLSVESSGRRFSKLTPVTEGARRSNRGGGSARPQAASATPSEITREERMRLDIQLVHRSANAWSVAAFGGILFAFALTACAPAKPREPAPVGASGQAAVADAQQSPNEPIEKYLAARSAG